MMSRHPEYENRWQRVIFFTIPVVIFFSYLFLASQADLGLAIPELVGTCAWIIVLLCVCQLHTDDPRYNISWPFILFWAAVFRYLFLWRVPELSDDIYRYVFDGLMVVTGKNPYLYAPSEIGAVAPQMAELARMVNHAHLPTIYPPAAQIIFAAGVMLGKMLNLSSLAGMKLLLVILDLASCIIIIKILTIFNLSKNRAILYAWHPLPVIEIAGSGHIDAAALFFLIAAVWLVVLINAQSRKGRAPQSSSRFLLAIAAGVFLAMSVLTKWLPLIFMPGLFLALRPRLRRYLFFCFLIASGGLIWPFLPEFVNGLHTLNTYLQNWEFSGFAFQHLRKLTGAGETARLLLGSGLFCIIAGLAFWQMRQKQTFLNMVIAFYIIALTYLVLTPTMHPWYALYLVFFLPFVVDSVLWLALGGLTLSWSVMLAYRILIAYRLQGVWVEDDLTAFLIVLAPGLAFLAGSALHFTRGGLRINANHG